MVAGLEERRWGNIPVGSLTGSGELGSCLRREVRVIQKDISSGLGNIVPLDTGLIHQAGLCPKMAETSCLCCVRVWMEWPDCKEPRIRPLKHLPHRTRTGQIQGIQGWFRELGSAEEAGM